MGGVIQSIFGGNQQSMPELPEATPAPTLEESRDPEAASVRDTERKRLQARRAMSGTLLTSPLGQNGSGPGGLLGRTN